MPLVWNAEKKSYELRCINDIEHLNKDLAPRIGLAMAAAAAKAEGVKPVVHEMQVAVNWVGVYGVAPPDTSKGGVAQITAQGIPLKAFVCQSCGYVEFYDGYVLSPDVWKKNV